MMPAWRCEGVSLRYPGAGRPAVEEVSLEVPPASCTAVIGPNGSGKSTLLRILLGVQVLDVGCVWFGDRPLADWNRNAMARVIGVVPQAEDSPFPITVRELVAMGRYPHLGPWRREGQQDRRAVEEALRRCDVAGFARRLVNTLSGGERQRVRIARALAQEPGALALDEPTAALDIAHEMAIWELLRELVHAGTTVLVVTHNLNVAARYADLLVLLDQGRIAAQGQPTEVLTRENVERVYGWPVRIVAHPGPGPDAGAPQVLPLMGTEHREERSHDAA
jgi:ABC-type cobalamin/Fe3+-siderophores transport system ATPase subunit